MKPFDFTLLRDLRESHYINLTTVSKATKLSIGFLNHLERGLISDIKNKTKRETLIKYIKSIK